MRLQDEAVTRFLTVTGSIISTASLGTVAVLIGARAMRRLPRYTSVPESADCEAEIIRQDLSPPEFSACHPNSAVETTKVKQHANIYLVALWVACAFVNRAVHSPFCALMFACGCRDIGSGGWTDCNVHREGPSCPWCLPWLEPSWDLYHPLDTAPDQDGVPTLAMLVVCWLCLPRATSWVSRNRSGGSAFHMVVRGALMALCVAALALVTYTISASAVGAVWALAYRYPYFFVTDVPAKHAPPSPPTQTGADSSGYGLALSMVVGAVGSFLWSAAISGVVRIPLSCVRPHWEASLPGLPSLAIVQSTWAPPVRLGFQTAGWFAMLYCAQWIRS